jgi:hypothetical protein
VHRPCHLPRPLGRQTDAVCPCLYYSRLFPIRVPAAAFQTRSPCGLASSVRPMITLAAETGELAVEVSERHHMDVLHQIHLAIRPEPSNAQPASLMSKVSKPRLPAVRVVLSTQ